MNGGDLRAWVRDVGFPIVVALLLLGLLLRQVPSLDSRVDAMQKTLEQHADSSYGRGTDTIRLLRAICRHGAHTELQLQDCNE